MQQSSRQETINQQVDQKDQIQQPQGQDTKITSAVRRQRLQSAKVGRSGPKLNTVQPSNPSAVHLRRELNNQSSGIPNFVKGSGSQNIGGLNQKSRAQSAIRRNNNNAKNVTISVNDNVGSERPQIFSPTLALSSNGGFYTTVSQKTSGPSLFKRSKQLGEELEARLAEDSKKTMSQTQASFNKKLTVGQIKANDREQAIKEHYEMLGKPLDTSIPTQVRFGSYADKVSETQAKIRRNKFDHKHFNVFIESVFGKALLAGLCDKDVDPNGTVSAYIRDNNTIEAALKCKKDEEHGCYKRERIVDHDTLYGPQGVHTDETRYYLEILQQNAHCSNPTKMADYFEKVVPNKLVPKTEYDRDRIKQRIFHELNKHSYKTLPKQVVTSDQIEKLVYQRERDLQPDVKLERERKQIVLKAMIFLFRSIGKKDWQECNLNNLNEKIEVLKNIDRSEMVRSILFDPEEAENMESMSVDQQQKLVKSRLQILKEAKSMGGQVSKTLDTKNYHQLATDMKLLVKKNQKKKEEEKAKRLRIQNVAKNALLKTFQKHYAGSTNQLEQLMGPQQPEQTSSEQSKIQSSKQETLQSQIGMAMQNKLLEKHEMNIERIKELDESDGQIISDLKQTIVARLEQNMANMQRGLLRIQNLQTSSSSPTKEVPLTKIQENQQFQFSRKRIIQQNFVQQPNYSQIKLSQQQSNPEKSLRQSRSKVQSMHKENVSRNRDHMLNSGTTLASANLQKSKFTGGALTSRVGSQNITSFNQKLRDKTHVATANPLSDNNLSTRQSGLFSTTRIQHHELVDEKSTFGRKRVSLPARQNENLAQDSSYNHQDPTSFIMSNSKIGLNSPNPIQLTSVDENLGPEINNFLQATGIASSCESPTSSVNDKSLRLTKLNQNGSFTQLQLQQATHSTESRAQTANSHQNHSAINTKIFQQIRCVTNDIVKKCDKEQALKNPFEQVDEDASCLAQEQINMELAIENVQERQSIDGGRDNGLAKISVALRLAQIEDNHTYQNFLNKKATTKFKAESTKVSMRLSELNKFAHKKKMWKQPKFSLGRYTALGKAIQQAN